MKFDVLNQQNPKREEELSLLEFFVDGDVRHLDDASRNLRAQEKNSLFASQEPKILMLGLQKILFSSLSSQVSEDLVEIYDEEGYKVSNKEELFRKVYSDLLVEESKFGESLFESLRQSILYGFGAIEYNPTRNTYESISTRNLSTQNVDGSLIFKVVLEKERFRKLYQRITGKDYRFLIDKIITFKWVVARASAIRYEFSGQKNIVNQVKGDNWYELYFFDQRSDPYIIQRGSKRNLYVFSWSSRLYESPALNALPSSRRLALFRSRIFSSTHYNSTPAYLSKMGNALDDNIKLKAGARLPLGADGLKFVSYPLDYQVIEYETQSLLTQIQQAFYVDTELMPMVLDRIRRKILLPIYSKYLEKDQRVDFATEDDILRKVKQLQISLEISQGIESLNGRVDRIDAYNQSRILNVFKPVELEQNPESDENSIDNPDLGI